MEFLAPVFAVAGLAAAGIPLVLHMLRRAPTERLPFSLVKFLKPSQPRLTRRSTIEHWPLLLLRILAVLLLGLAFGRPFQRSVDPGAHAAHSGHSVTLLVDRSASMRRRGIHDAVEQEIRTTVESLQVSDQLQVILFSDATETVLSFEEWATLSDGEKSAAIDRLCSGYEADWQGTRTGQALLQTAEDLIQDADDLADHEIVLITDFQEGSDFSTLPSADWPGSVQVSLRRMTSIDAGNAALRTMVDRRSGKTLVRVSNTGDAIHTQFQLQPVTSAGLPAGPQIPVNVLPGRQTTVRLDQLHPSEDATQLELTGDDHEFDNRTSLPLHRAQISRIAHVGSTDVNDAEDMRYYLQRALDGMLSEEDQELGTSITLVDTVTADGLVLPIDSDIDLAILTDAAPPELLPSLQAVLDRGGVLVAALRSELMAASIQELLPAGITVSESPVSDYAMLGQIDFEHPLFARFSDVRFADFSSIRFWQHRIIGLTPPTDQTADGPVPWTVIARFDSGLPAVVRVRREGQGSVFLLASGWHPEDSQWALSSRFAPMLAGFRQLARPPKAETQHVEVGDIIDPAAEFSSTAWQLQLPDGTSRSSADISSQDDGSHQVTIDQPGTWHLRSTADDQETPVTLLAQLPPEESLTAPLPEGQLYALKLAGDEAAGDAQNSSTSAAIVSRRSGASAEQLEAQQRYWRWFLLAGLSCLILEAVLAAVIHRRQLQEVA